MAEDAMKGVKKGEERQITPVTLDPPLPPATAHTLRTVCQNDRRCLSNLQL